MNTTSKLPRIIQIKDAINSVANTSRKGNMYYNFGFNSKKSFNNYLSVAKSILMDIYLKVINTTTTMDLYESTIQIHSQ